MPSKRYTEPVKPGSVTEYDELLNAVSQSVMAYDLGDATFHETAIRLSQLSTTMLGIKDRYEDGTVPRQPEPYDVGW